MQKTDITGSPRILGRRLAKELSREDLAEITGSIELSGIATTTLIYPPDKDKLSGGTPELFPGTL